MRSSLLPALLLTVAVVAQDGGPPKRAGHGKGHDQDRPVNRLAKETSPYLLQHQHNPVDWWPWGPEAIAKARELDKPIFLSIGYAACHWCHVMERESFEDEATAKLMNSSFICIKVDREERPDIDEIYMAATTGMTGHGGWPMSVWMTPDLKPFYAGTYFPPKEGRGMPSFTRVIEHINGLWKEQRATVDERADQVVGYLKERLAPKAEPNDAKLADLDTAVEQSAQRFDKERGGFGQPDRFAPKFPHASELLLLLRQHARTKDPQALAMATKTLTEMAHGGIYDQIGGGFHRYSVDREWLVPHFEKMLYDNAQLARVYAEAHLLTGDELYGRIARETLDYLIREMQDPKGGIWSTTDADSEGEDGESEEGAFFVWSKAAIETALGAADAEIFCQRFGVTSGGNFEGHSIPFVARSVDEVATAVGKTVEDVQASLAASRAKLYELRKERVPPGTDDKVLAAWNGLAITAFAEGYITFGDERYLEAARRVAQFVLTDLRRDDGRLFRTWRRGRAQLDAYLEDYAFVADGLVRLFECDFDPRWLREARGMLKIIDEHFGDDADGSFFFTADDHEELIARTKSVSESSVPSGIAVAVTAHLRGSLLTGDEALWERGVRALRAHHVEISRYGIACPALMLAVDFALGDPREVVVAGPRSEGVTLDLVNAARREVPRRHVVMLVDDRNRSGLADLTSIIEGKSELDGLPAAFVCRRGTCEAPVTDPALLRLR